MPGFFSRGGGRSVRSPGRIEEVFYPAVLADPNVDADHLTALLRDPSPLIAQQDEYDEYHAWRTAEAAEAAPEPEHLAVRVAKLAALVTAIALLCAAIVAAAFLDKQRRSTPPAGQPTHITGVRALAGVTSDGGTTAVPEPAAQLPGGASSSQGAIWTPRDAASTDPCVLAADFYRLIAERPREALSVLGSPLTDDDRRELAVAWHDVDHVDVHDLRRLPDGLIATTVTVINGPGEQVRLRQLLRVEPPEITEVRLLSSQQLADGAEVGEGGTASGCAE